MKKAGHNSESLMKSYSGKEAFRTLKLGNGRVSFTSYDNGSLDVTIDGQRPVFLDAFEARKLKGLLLGELR